MKRAISLLLTFAMLLSMFTVFFATSALAATVITNTSPAIAVNVGTKITLSNYSVVFDGDSSATSGVTWKNGSTTITSFTPSAKGVTKLTATSGSKSKSIYVVAKNASESEYVLYEANMADYTTDKLTSDGWTLTSGASMLEGDLIVSSTSVFLPSWLGEFGDYALSGDFRIKSATNTSRWFSLIIRADQLSTNPSYVQMCVRSDTTAASGVEFTEKYNNNGSGTWNVIKNTSGVHSQMGEKYRNVRIAAYGKTVSNELCGEQVIYIDPTTYTEGIKTATNKGYLGLTMDSGELRVKNVRVTLQTSAPVQAKGMINNDYHKAENLENAIANVQAMSSATASLSNLSLAYYDLTTGINAVDAMTAAVNANVVPTFYVATEAQAYEVMSAARITGNNDANVIVETAALAEYVRRMNNMMSIGLKMDISDKLSDGIMTDAEANEIRVATRNAPATYIVISSRYAEKQAVAELQKLAIGVWVQVDWAAGTEQFTRDTVKAITSGANGVITASALEVSNYIATYFEENTFTRTPLTIGHRGNPGVAPENTIASFEAAYANGADVIEIDVQMTSDSIVVVCHDSTLNRTTNYDGSKKISEMTWDEVKTYKVLDIDGVTVLEDRIPTLDETLVWANGKDIKMFIEFKNSTSDCIKQTMNRVKYYGMSKQVDVISFNRSALAYTQSYHTGMSTGFLIGSTFECNDYATALELFQSRVRKANDVKSTINPESYSNQINKLVVQAATDRGMTIWPYTFNSSTTNPAFFIAPDGITTNNMELVKDMVKQLQSSNFGLELGEAYNGKDIKYETYGNNVVAIDPSELIIHVITGDSVAVQDGKLVAVKDGSSSVIFGYRTESYTGDEYVVYTQPVTVRVGATADANGEKIVYIPLDNRPINKERVEYMAEASGFELIMPDDSLYSNRIDFYNEGVSDQGNPEELFAWLKTVEDAKYYVISLDMLLSGGLIGSRAPFGDTDDTIASDISGYDWKKGGYTLSAKEQEIIDYLIALSAREDTHVVFFDTVMRLASTGDYMDYRGNDYSNFRMYGMLARPQYTGSDLTIANIVKNYNKDANGNDIAVPYTDAATQGSSNYTSGYEVGSSMIFTDGNGTLRALSNAEFNEYYASRERKLVIANALYPNVVDTADRLYIGFDDSSPQTTIQSNEGRYITEKLIGDAENCVLFSAADELGMMGLADIATSIYGKVDVSPIFFGNGKDIASDEYDTGTLNTTVQAHITGVGCTRNDNASGELQVLILTRTDGGDGYSSSELTELNNQAAKLVQKAISNLNMGIPTAIVDCSDKDGVLSNAILGSELKTRLGELLGYSQWNTIANSLGTSISNAVARYTYLKNSVVVDEDTHKGFMKTVVAAWVKDVAYQQTGGRIHNSSANFAENNGNYNKAIDMAETLVNYINASKLVEGVDNGVIVASDKWNATVSSFRWPWDRAFEAVFDITVGENLQYRETVDYEDYKVVNATLGKGYTVSHTPGDSYPDTDNKELTDGVSISSSETVAYGDSRWVGYIVPTDKNRTVDITIPLGETYNLYQFKINLGTAKLGAGISRPAVEFQVSTDGKTFTKVRSIAYNRDTSTYAVDAYAGAAFESVKATHVKVLITPVAGNLMWVSEIAAYGTKVEEKVTTEAQIPVHTYTTDDTYKWWPNWNTPPCAEGATYDDGKRLIDGTKNVLEFGEEVSGWYNGQRAFDVEMTFNLFKASNVTEIVASFDKYSTYATPTGCKVEVSTDGVNYSEVEATFSTALDTEASSIWASYDCTVKLAKPAFAKYVRLTFSGAALYLFEEVEFYGTSLESIVAGNPYETSGEPEGRYTAENYGLTDGFTNKRTVYNNTCWLWSGNNTVANVGSILLQLDKTYDLTGVSVHTNAFETSGITKTDWIKVYVSTDGVNFKLLGTVVPPLYNNDSYELVWAELFKEAKCVNFVKIEMCKTKGFSGLDEIEVYGTEPAMSGIHKLSSDWSLDANNHWHECSCGEKFDVSSHDDGVWVTTKEADIDVEGRKELQCTVCGYVIESKSIPAKHSFGDDWVTDANNHWHECACGLKEDLAAHDEGTWVTVKPADIDVEGKKELRCTVCNYVLDTATIPAKHSFGDAWATDANNHWHECACGEKTDTAAHDEGTWVTVKPADIDVEGKKELRCTVCAYVLKTESIPAKHSFGEAWVTDANNHWHECACGEKADTAAHTAGDWEVTTPATTEKVGEQVKKCTVCSYILETKEIPKIPVAHNHTSTGAWVTDSKNHWHTCSCGEVLDKASHDNGTWVTTKEADIDVEGKKELRCTVCQYVLDTATIPAKHSFGDAWVTDANNHWHECGCGEKSDVSAHDNGTWVVVKQAEVDVEGKKELRCTVCQYVLETATIPAKHSFGDAWVTDANNHWHECDCGEKSDVSAHDNGTWVVVKQAEIDVEGKKELRCTVCQYVLDTATIPAKHSFSEDWKSDMLNHWHECACGETADLAPHTAGDWEVKTPATLEKEGEQIKKCTVCSYVLESKEIPKLEPTHTHSAVGAWSSDANNHWHTCSCGEALDQASHDDGTWVTVKEADIDVEGKKELRCTVCGYVLDTATIPAKHSFGESWVTDKNNHWHECDCGEKSDLASHDDGTWVTVKEADIDVEGKKELRCTVCNYVLETATIPAKHSFNDGWQIDKNNHWHECDCGEKSDLAPHTAGDWEVKTPATTQKAGEQIKKCTVCSYILETKEIPKLEEAHKHTAAGDWKHDETGHWKECACGEKVDFQPHTEEDCDCGYEVEIEDDYMLGDVNKNGEIDSMDYVLVKRAYFGTFTFDEDQFKRGDVNRSNEIDSMDYVLIKRAYFGTFQIK